MRCVVTRLSRSLPEIGSDELLDEPAVLANGRRRQVLGNVIEPPGEQLAERGTRRRDLAGRHVGHECGERSLGFALGAEVSPAELAPLAGRVVTRELNDQLPVPRAALTERTLHAAGPSRKAWLAAWLRI